MLLKKPTIALCTSGSLSSALSLPAAASITSSIGPPSTSTSTSTSTPKSPSTSTISPHIRPLRRSKLCTNSQWRSSRRYATVRDEPRRNDDDPASPTWPKSKNPTPYEIFDQAKSTPYSKKTFYQLVKLYHPDRHAHAHTSGPDGSITQKAKLERYRLVVAANDILSDPTKRRAYDLYGAGWGGTSEMSNTAYREADRAWRAQAGTAAHNATWEDWERWHWENNSRRRDGAAGRSEPRYMSNGLFVMTICVFVLIGGWGQATRAGKHGMYLVEMQEKKDVHISEEMWRRRREKAMLTREDRVENFLRSREGWDTAINDSHTPKG